MRAVIPAAWTSNKTVLNKHFWSAFLQAGGGGQYQLETRYDWECGLKRERESEGKWGNVTAAFLLHHFDTHASWRVCCWELHRERERERESKATRRNSRLLCKIMINVFTSLSNYLCEMYPPLHIYTLTLTHTYVCNPSNIHFTYTLIHMLSHKLEHVSFVVLLRI